MEDFIVVVLDDTEKKIIQDNAIKEKQTLSTFMRKIVLNQINKNMRSFK